MFNKIILFPIKGYQKFISPMLGPHCRFTPTCSEYAVQAIEQHGIMRGLFLATRRVFKCHPLHQGGIDPVPHKHSEHS